jgi:L-aspartate oxidase
MGGVRTDLRGRTSLPRLFAAGEAACTGVHGANRLASNSLLEGLVFGARAGQTMRESAAIGAGHAALPVHDWPGGLPRHEIQRIAWEQCGIVRDGEGLRAACARLERTESAHPAGFTPESAEARNMQQVALLIARSALAREESRGAHFRTDFPEKHAARGKHSTARGNDAIGFHGNG